jgi:hypothetical protein
LRVFNTARRIRLTGSSAIFQCLTDNSGSNPGVPATSFLTPTKLFEVLRFGKPNARLI